MNVDQIEETTIIDKTADRARRNMLSATAMLGHLCALYDRGVFEAGRLMANLVFQLAVARPSNAPLLAQLGLLESLTITVENYTVESATDEPAGVNSLVELMFGLRADRFGQMQPAAHWIPAFSKLTPPNGFKCLPLKEWLNELVIPTGTERLSREKLVAYIRDQDGGAHSDPDKRLLKSTSYLDLVNSFPISKMSMIDLQGHKSIPWELLPPVTMPLMRQISHELVSALLCQTDALQHIGMPPCVFGEYNSAEFSGAWMPSRDSFKNNVHGSRPRVVDRPIAPQSWSFALRREAEAPTPNAP